eukprot:TRINITY_DN8283_c0_g1_i1.p1 TRINITY_DN8283_c0_g1~~TRINITY_DN8283_c0_g1_i1.p1  ORF type:complete len:240 (+),score=32.80 TRINITY_DN8283_c0_g1_i1:66-785(+)
MADQMPASLAAIQAAGAMSLDLEVAPTAGAEVEASPMQISPWATSTYCTSPGSPWSPATPAVCPVTPSMRQQFAVSSPIRMGNMHGYGVVSQNPGATSRGLTSPGHFVAMPSHSAGPRSPLMVGTMPQSPGAVIRQNAASMGIPLHLRSSPGEVSAPVPVRSFFGVAAAPSPGARPAPSAPVPVSMATGLPAQMNEVGAAHTTTLAAAAVQHGQLPLLLRNVVTPFTSTRHRAVGGFGK